MGKKSRKPIEFYSVFLASLINDGKFDPGQRVAIEKFTREYTKTLRGMSPGKGRALWLHRELDSVNSQRRDIEKLDESDVSCKKGCSHCCHYSVGVTNDEADLLQDKLRSMIRGGLMDKKAVMEKLEYQAPLDYKEYNKISREESACVFLKDGACSVYDERPMACRNFLVVSDPKGCIPVNGETPVAERLVNLQAEILDSAGQRANLGRHPKTQSMAKMLFNRLKGVKL